MTNVKLWRENTFFSCLCSSKVTDRLICTVCRLRPPSIFHFLLPSLIERDQKQTVRTDSVLERLPRSCLPVCYPWYYLILGIFVSGHTKNKRRVDCYILTTGDVPLSCVHCRRCLFSSFIHRLFVSADHILFRVYTCWGCVTSQHFELGSSYVLLALTLVGYGSVFEAVYFYNKQYISWRSKLYNASLFISPAAVLKAAGIHGFHGMCRQQNS